MVDYNFYTSGFRGGSIPEEEFPRLVQRAWEKLEQYKRVYTVVVPAGSKDAESMALCAMADALYTFEEATAPGGALAAGSVSVGSVSTSRAQGAAIDCSPKAQEKELLSCARLYLEVERWCGPC